MDENTQKYVKFLRALGSEERLAILEEIETKGQINCTEVEKKFFMEESTASHHLNILKKADILESKKAGRNIYYSIKDHFMEDFYKDFTNRLNAKKAEKEQVKTRDAVNS